MNNNELTHHGVLGMKWGVRRTEAQLARARGSSSKTIYGGTTPKTIGEGKKTQIKPKTKSDYLTDKELKDRINRIKLEKEYEQLTAKEKSRGRKFLEQHVMPTVIGIGKSYVTQYANRLIGQKLDATFGKKGDDKNNNSSDNNGPKPPSGGSGGNGPKININDFFSSKSNAKSGNNKNDYMDADWEPKKKESFTPGPDDIYGEGASRVNKNTNGERKRNTSTIYTDDFTDKSESTSSRANDTLKGLLTSVATNLPAVYNQTGNDNGKRLLLN